MSKRIKLTVAMVDMRKAGKSKHAIKRQGYEDENGQTFMPPKAEKRKNSWRIKMTDAGYDF